MESDNNNKKSFRLNKDQTISLYKSKENELKLISQKLQEIEGLFIEILKAESTLNEIKNIKASESLLINVGAGILVECMVNNVNDVKISLPGSIIVSKDIDSVIADIDNRKKELLDIKQRFSENYESSLNTLQQISKALHVMHKQESKVPESNIVS